MKRRNVFIGAGFVALLAALGVGQSVLEQKAIAHFDAMKPEGVSARLTSVAPDLNQNTMTVAAAAEVALAVKNVGHALAARGIKPGYSQVYGEMYRRYGISSYKNLSCSKFEEVLTWLRSWYDELVGESAADGQ